MLSRCLNLDWLEVYLLEPLLPPVHDASFFRSLGWQVVEREYGTRSYRQMFTLYDQQGFPFVEVRREPVGFFKDGSRNFSCEIGGCHVRLVNRYCYADNAVNILQEFITRYGYTFSRIAKVDLALDFVTFDYGDLPSKFVKRYIAGKYSKINQSRLAAHGADYWSGRDWHSLAWGADKSPVFTRLYNKVVELREVKDKPYIRQAWALAGLVDNPVDLTLSGEPVSVWRLEFSVRSSVKRWVSVKMESGPNKYCSLRNTLEVYATKESMWQMFASLASHYFHFKKFEEGKSKYVCKDKKLFDFAGVQAFYKVEKIATDKQPDNTLIRLKSLLMEFVHRYYTSSSKELALKMVEEIDELRLREMASDFWDMDEVELLRLLLVRRLDCPQEPMQLSRSIVKEFVELEKSLWSSNVDCEESYD